MRLVLGLHERDDGYVELAAMGRGGGLTNESLLFEDDPHHLNYRVRGCFRAALGELSEKKFIEVNGRRVRLSTHKKFVTWDEERLLDHADERVRGLVRLLLDRARSPADAPAPA